VLALARVNSTVGRFLTRATIAFRIKEFENEEADSTLAERRDSIFDGQRFGFVHFANHVLADAACLVARFE
jgi:hypothetical protein